MQFRCIRSFFSDRFYNCGKMRFVHVSFNQAASCFCLKERFYSPVMESHNLQNFTNSSYSKQIFCLRLFNQWVFLSNHKNLTVTFKGFFERGNRKSTTDEKRCCHLRKDHDITHWQHRQRNLIWSSRFFLVSAGHKLPFIELGE